jgi:type I restriction enzyme S subunit
MSFPRYPAYKPSGVEWLGEVPEHWSIKQLKHCIHRLGSGGTPESGNPEYWADNESDDSIPWVAIGDMSSARVVYSTAKSLTQAGVKEKNLEIFPAGSLLYSIYASLGKVSILGVDAAFNQAILAIVSNPGFVSQPFLKYWLESIEKHLSYYSSSNTQANLNAAKVLSYPVAVPHPDEQARIATFLDRETAKIDALIAEQQRLIELLQEKRQAVISHAVTKGLNPNAPMKDSGVEWLGEVPEHWEVTPLMRLTQPTRPIMYGIVLPGPDVGEGVPILKGGNIKPSRLRLECMARTTPEIEAPFARARLRADDLVYGIRGSIGDCEIVPIELEGCNITQDVARIAPLSCLCPRWLRYAMLSRPVAEGLACGSLGAAVKGVNIFDLKRARIPLPPPHEMKCIADFLSLEESRLLSLSLSAESAIGLLQERRSALISAAVTGQIDVRGMLPEADAA